MENTKIRCSYSICGSRLVSNLKLFTHYTAKKNEPIAQILAFELLYVQKKTMIREKTTKYLLGNYAKKKQQ